MNTSIDVLIAVVGAGPSGLFASEYLLRAGFSVSLYDQMPSAGCKFLTAGNHGGLNITNAAPLAEFASRYGENQKLFTEFLTDFSPTDMHEWLASLGIKTFTGSGGKIFPQDISTAEILSRWMCRLESFSGFSFFPSHRLVSIRNERTLVFETGDIECEVTPRAILFALGGASWPATGSDGKWTQIFAGKNIELANFESANCGFETDWSPYLTKMLQYIPLKNICMSVSGKTLRGELMLTPYGIEGSLVYSLGLYIRSEIKKYGHCVLSLDFLPDWTEEKIKERLGKGPGKDSLSNYVRKKLHLDAVCVSLLRENLKAEDLKNTVYLSSLIKRFPLTVYRSRPLAQAISSAGGVCFSNLDENLMLQKFPGLFCAGEMLDWESPTGGFLLQGCFSTGYRAANSCVTFCEGL